MNKFYILQSGFASTTDRGFYKDLAEKTSFRQQVLNQDMDLSRSEYYFSPVVTSLVNEYMADYRVLQNFDFRHKLLEAAFACFNVRNIQDWLNAQRKSVFLADLQKGFIIETMNFVCGKPRSMSPVQWARLLDTSIANQNVKFEYEDLFAKNHAPNPVPNEIHDFIHSWITQENGFEDLLISMWLIFGRRVVKQTINYPVNRSDNGEAAVAALASAVAGV